MPALGFVSLVAVGAIVACTGFKTINSSVGIPDEYNTAVAVFI